ncbi:MAG: excinuclease ABC subunit A, partial [Myxococcota bacterium]
MSSKGRRTGGTKKSQDLQDIQIRGARQNNLGGVDVDIPKARLTVVTGVSGSGKSSLAFDTLYAEGQRRYVESFSTYARQFLERMDRPDVDSIDGLLPAVALEQKNAIRSSRSTLATLTEVADYLKVLFAKLATLLCPTCGNVVEPDLPGPIVDELLTTHAGKRLIVTFPFRAGEGEDAVIASQFLQREGFGRILGDEGSVIRLEGLDAQTGKLAVIIDRLAIRDIERQRLVEAIETAYTASHGEATLHIEGQKGVFEIRDLFQERHCCGVTYPAPVEGVFSFNSPIGACETCRGFGRVIDIDMHRVVPDDRLTLKQGAIAPWTGNKGIKRRKALREICADADIDYEKTPWRELSTAQQDLILEGRGGPRGWDGVRGWFKALETKLYKMHVRVFLSRYRSYLPCGDCGGSRFKAESLYYRLGEVTIADVLASTVQDAKHWLETLPVTSTVDALAPVVEHLTNRLYYLVHVGIGYLTLSRQARTLSGGEVQRANLTTALGSGLVNTLFVLDEPTIGLHPADSDRLAVMLAELTERDNTVVLVEHDPDMLRVADHIIEMGPGPGALGGEVIFAGEASALATTAKTSATALALAHRQGPRVARNADVTVLPGVTIRGASAQNLKGVDAHFPYGHLTVVSGVSGSGKSTLMGQVLHRGYLRRNGKVTDAPGACEAIDGLDRISELIWVDQSPPAASSRANPATYVKAWDGVRKLFAEQPLSKRRRYTPGTFSFNSGDGRCPACEGAGFEKVEMQFLADVQLRCEACEGTRFKPSVLEVKWEGLSVADVLSLTVEEACVRFGKTAGVARRLKALQDVGLGYLRLGQSLATLSGGESQRVKLAQHLHARKKQRHLMFLLDEPTTGLHLADVDRLVDNLRVLTQRGNTVVVIEHHLDVIAAADHVIDLGPEGGDRGGSIVFAGSPRGLSESGTLTGEHLARWLAGIAPLERPAASASKPKKRTSHLGGDVAIAGARVHNLKNISVRFPRGKRTVVSGVSGSGKSSLAFDIVFAEGQRRFLDCVSAYARQYITQLARPDADVIAGIPPTVAIEQRTTRGGSRSTVANVTEIEPFLRLLYARLGEVRQDASGRVTPKALAEHLDLVDGSAQVSVTAPVVQSRQGFHQKVFVDAHELGIKVFVNGTLRSPNPLPRLRRRNHHDVDFLYGTLAANSGADLAKAIARAAIKANGQVKVFRDGFTPRLFEVAAEGVTRRETLDPRYFSPRTSLGACVECSGRGIISPDDREDDMPDIVCPSCDGQRLGPIGRSVAISGRSLPELTAMTAPGVVAFLDGLKLDKRKQAIAAGPVKAIRERAQFLDEVGLTYLTLNRGVRTLSGGESQRIRLAAQLGAHLSGVLYVLDEPTIGLHPTDTEVLLSTLDRLQARGNGILMVEHD